jgi:hypothetical protein
MSTNRFPQMLYRLPATQPDAPTLQDGRYDTRIVHDEEAHGAALADGWHEDHGRARQAHDALLAAAAEAAAAEAAQRDAEELAKLLSAPPTREEMEAKARELGLKFDGRTGDAKLLRLIEAALAPA